MKQFPTKESLDKWILENFPKETSDAWDISPIDASEHEIAEKLIAEGYDLDNLIEDGHAYEIDGHTNNGWLYEDEADKFYIESQGLNVELRKREIAD